MILYQLALAVAVIVGFSLLNSPSTFTFFIFEIVVALALGVLTYWRGRQQAQPEVDSDNREHATTVTATNHRSDSGPAPGEAVHGSPPESQSGLVRFRSHHEPDYGPAALTSTRLDAASQEERLVALVAAGRRSLDRKDLSTHATREYATAVTEAKNAAGVGDTTTAVQVLTRANARLRRNVHRSTEEPRGAALQDSRRMFLILTSVYLVLYGVAVLELSVSLYVAPLGFYLAVGIACGALGANIYANGENRIPSLLAQVLSLAILVKYYFFFLNPYVYTSDVFLYYNGLRGLQVSGFVPPSLGNYFYFPDMFTYAFAGSAVTYAPLEFFGTFVFASQVAMIPTIYLIGDQLAGRRVGLLAALFGIFWTYGFAWALPNTSQFGMLFIFLAIYGTIRLASRSERGWLALFWVSALAALFSHPINALILAAILGVRYLLFLWRHRTIAVQAAAVPASAFGIVYGSYLSYVAVTTFSLFVQTFFIRDSAPVLATSTLTAALEKSSAFVFQSALAPLSMAIPVFFAGYALLRTSRMPKIEHDFLVVLGAICLALPGLEFAAGNFKFQSSRLLIYLAIPLVFLAANGLVTIGRHRQRTLRVVAAVFVVFLLLGFLSPSSYLSQGDSRALYTALPFASIHVTASAVASRPFLTLTLDKSTIYLDAGMARYFENSDRARDALVGYETLPLESLNTSAPVGFVVLNAHYLPYGASAVGTFYDVTQIRTSLASVQSNLLYDSGTVQIYFAP